MRVTYTVVFRWKKVPLDKEQADYIGSMGDFKDYSEAVKAFVMLKHALGDDWEFWINKHEEGCEQMFP